MACMWPNKGFGTIKNEIHVEVIAIVRGRVGVTQHKRNMFGGHMENRKQGERKREEGKDGGKRSIL